MKFRHLNTTDGLSQNNVFSIIQDHKGFMWFGTEDGLNKFDGNKFTIYRNTAADSQSISHNNIKTIFEDSENNLWIGTFGGGLNLYDREQDKFIVFKTIYEDPTTLINNYIEVIFEDSKGDLWIGTPSGLNVFNKKDHTVSRILRDPADPHSLSDERIEEIYEDKNGNFWIGTMNGLNLFDRETGKSKKFFHEPENPISLSNNHINKIREDKNGTLWIGTNGGGLNAFNPETETFTHFRHNPQDPSSLGNDVILEVYNDPQGRLWIGTENGGLNLFHPNTASFSRFVPETGEDHSLSNSSVNTVFQDKSGTLWVGVYRGGVNYHNPVQQKFKLHAANYFKNAINNNSIKGFYEDRKGNIWIATDGGGLNLYNRKTDTFSNYLPEEGNPNSLNAYAAHAVLGDGQDNLWIGTYGGGLNKFNRENNEFIHYKHSAEDSNSIASNNVVSMLEDAKGNLWLGTSGGGLNRLDKNSSDFIRFKCGGGESDKIGSCWVNTLYEDSKGNIWIGTSWGLNAYSYNTNSFSHFHTDQNQPGTGGNISSEEIFAIFEDQKGNLWIGTKNGLNLFDYTSQQFSSFKIEDGLPSNTITSIQEDAHGNLWLGTFNGLSRFNPTTKAVRNFSIAEGLQGNEFSPNASLKAKSGELFFGGTDGFNMFHPDSLKDNTYKPPVYLTSFSIFNKIVKAGDDSFLRKQINEVKEIILSYRESLFSFEFAALNYIDSENNEYAYKLEGFDQDWNYIGHNRSATYTNLDPGQYTFRVKASNNDGLWNEEGTALSLIITPPYWQTWWFRVVVAFSIIGGALTFYKQKINAVKAQKARLERQVKEQTADIRKANDELMERQEEILQQQEELAAQTEVLQDTNNNLRQSQEEIALQRDHLKIANEQVMSSIQYAQTIQMAILPSAEKIGQEFPEHFILYRPKDVVSGDFYWFTQLAKEDSGLQADLSFMAVVDCTGHGVPGAFMSIIGSTLLNEIINQKQILDPAQILELLDLGVKKAVAKAKNINTAGMDVGLCRFEKEAGKQTKILFSGAKRDLLYVKSGSREVEELAADRRSIGSESTLAFTTQQLVLDEKSILYMTTDGYADQNNVARDKLGSTKLKLLLSQFTDLSPQEQKAELENILDEHQEGTEQRDDITLMGIRL